jgi:hypothetical protein
MFFFIVASGKAVVTVSLHTKIVLFQTKDFFRYGGPRACDGKREGVLF